MDENSRGLFSDNATKLIRMNSENKKAMENLRYVSLRVVT